MNLTSLRVCRHVERVVHANVGEGSARGGPPHAACCDRCVGFGFVVFTIRFEMVCSPLVVPPLAGLSLGTPSLPPSRPSSLVFLFEPSKFPIYSEFRQLEMLCTCCLRRRLSDTSTRTTSPPRLQCHVIELAIQVEPRSPASLVPSLLSTGHAMRHVISSRIVTSASFAYACAGCCRFGVRERPPTGMPALGFHALVRRRRVQEGEPRLVLPGAFFFAPALVIVGRTDDKPEFFQSGCSPANMGEKQGPQPKRRGKLFSVRGKLMKNTRPGNNRNSPRGGVEWARVVLGYPQNVSGK